MDRIFMILKIKLTHLSLPWGYMFITVKYFWYMSQISGEHLQNHWSYGYTPGIYADGYIAFDFPFVCSFVRSCIRSLFRNSLFVHVIPERSWNLCQSFGESFSNSV